MHDVSRGDGPVGEPGIARSSKLSKMDMIVDVLLADDRSFVELVEQQSSKASLLKTLLTNFMLLIPRLCWI